MDEKVSAALNEGGVIDITTTGRKSGQARRIEIAFHNIEGRIYISGFPRPEKRGWLANLETNPAFTFHLKQGVQADLPARARSIVASQERRPLLEKVAQAWQRNDIEEMVEHSPLVEVTILDAS